MSDLIDRNELIDCFCQKNCGFNPKECALFPCYEIEIIKNAPSAVYLSDLYLCDPDKNTECKKTMCYRNGGECIHTVHKEYRRVE